MNIVTYIPLTHEYLSNHKFCQMTIVPRRHQHARNEFALGSYRAAAPEIYYWSATHRTATRANRNVG